MTARVLVIGGVDSSGGAGIVADLRALAAVGVEAAVAVTAVTAQTMSTVHAVVPTDLQLLHAQIAAALDEPVAAVKVGLLPTAGAVEVVSGLAKGLDVPIVLDPVLAASSGHPLATGTLGPLEQLLVPLAAVVTPNIDELSLLTNCTVTDLATVEKAAAELVSRGARWVLATGGHLDGPEAIDILTDGTEFVRYSGPRRAADVRGTGCTLASLVAAGLSRGHDVTEAVQAAKGELSQMFDTLVATPSGRSRFGPRFGLR